MEKIGMHAAATLGVGVLGHGRGPVVGHSQASASRAPIETRDRLDGKQENRTVVPMPSMLDRCINVAQQEIENPFPRKPDAGGWAAPRHYAEMCGRVLRNPDPEGGRELGTPRDRTRKRDGIPIPRVTAQKMTGFQRIVRVEDRRIGQGQPCFIVAEAGVNHNGDLSIARRLVEVAVNVVADAVKFQTFKADRLVTQAESQYEMLRRLELSEEAHRDLMAECRRKGILFISTAFDEESADLLDALGVVLFKIPSGEVINLPFLSHVARKGKPMILSTGMSTLEEVEAAVRTIQEAGNWELVLLHCVSNYPADPADANLRAMQTMAAHFGLPVGYSDHTPGVEVALAAVALGACVIEKHFTLDKEMPGPDHCASAAPEELAALVRGIRLVESALGHGRKVPASSEIPMSAMVRKSIVAARDIPAGTPLANDSLTAKRPGTGLSPALREQLVGRIAKWHIPKGSLITLECVE